MLIKSFPVSVNTQSAQGEELARCRFGLDWNAPKREASVFG
jgi:hypothetical protein